MNRTKERIASAVGFCLLWSMILFVLFAAVYNISGDEALLSAEMHRHAPPKVSGLPEDRYPYMAHMIASYLTDKRPGFQYYYTDADGNLIVCFQPHEAEHMADCRKLIRLAEILRLVFWLLGMMIVIAGILMPKRRKGIARGVIIGLVSAGAVGTVLLIWGVIDFDGLFTAFHRIAFTNDGWLLDPRTDLLIRLMPTELFIRLAARILLWVMGAAIVMAIVARVIYRGAFRSNPT